MDDSMSSTDHDCLCKTVYGDSLDMLFQLANEPSMAFYRIQEHVRKTTPELIRQRNQLYSVSEKINGICFDIDHSLSALAAVPVAQSNLSTLLETLKSTTALQQELNIKWQKRKNRVTEDVEVGVDVAAAIIDR